MTMLVTIDIYLQVPHFLDFVGKGIQSLPSQTLISNPYIFPLFQPNVVDLKYFKQRVTPSDYKDIGIRKFKYVAKTKFLLKIKIGKYLTIFFNFWIYKNLQKPDQT